MAPTTALRREWARGLGARPETAARGLGEAGRSPGAALAAALRPGLEARLGGMLEAPLTDRLAELLGRLDEPENDPRPAPRARQQG
jgi:hypothetical protein